MSEAVRKVTIIVDVKPGEIVKPDVSWIEAASTGMKELVTEQNAVTEMVKKTREESQALVKTQVDAVKVENELKEVKEKSAKESQDNIKEETAAHKKQLEEKKRNTEEYDTWAAGQQARFAENQRRIDEQAAQRKAEAQKQQKEVAAKPFEIPTPNPRLPLREPGEQGQSRVDYREEQLQQQRDRQKRADEAESQRRKQAHEQELAEIDKKNEEERKKQEQEERKLQEAKYDLAQRTLQKIKVAELANVRERLQAEEEEQERKIETANRLLEKIKRSELANVRERLQEEQEQQERKVETANRIFQKIRRSELANVRERLQEEQEEQDRKVELAERTIKKIKQMELANIRERVKEAEETFEEIRKSEIKHAKERRDGAAKAEDDMPKHWRNVGLNAGQAVASAARYIGHMRMLKNVGGDALEDIAKKFMTVQSRVETVSASTAAFTNFGTMVDGLEKAGKETAKVVAQQTILKQETTLTQLATMKLGTTAAAIAPMIAPMQFAFTAITAAIVAADIAMDFMTESTEEAKQKAQEYQAAFNEQLSETISKLQTETDMIKGQSNALIEQWEIKKLLAGDEGLSAQEISTRNEQMRQRSDTDSMRKIQTSVTEVFQSGLSDEQQAEAGRLAEERKKTEKRIKEFSQSLAYEKALRESDPNYNNETAEKYYSSNIAADKEKLKKLDNDQYKFDLLTGKSIQEQIGKTKITDGVIEDFAALEKQLQLLPKSMEESGKKMLLVIENELISGSQTNRNQAAEAKQAARNASIEKIQQENVLKDATAAKEDEAAVANRFNLQESKFAMKEVETLLKQTENPAATIDQKSQSVKNIRDVLGRADLVTPELSKILERGASANPADIRSALTDAKEFTQAEQREADDLIKKANEAIQKAQAESEEMTVIADKMTRLLESNAKQLQQLRQAMDARDGI